MYRFILPALLLPVLLPIAGSAALSRDTGYKQRQAAAEQAKLDRALTGLVPGRPQDCIDQTRFNNDTTRVGDTILYRYSPRLIYRTDTGGGCFGLRRGDAIITVSHTGHLCRGDIVRTVDLVSHISSGSCTFGDFVPYQRP